MRKNSGEIGICVDYRELNKLTIKDAYPLPLMEAGRSCNIHLAGSIQSGYWQLPVDVKDREKTAFSPGPGMGSFEFTRMPFGLCGAPSSFQRLMDKITRGLPFVTTYIDEVLIHSVNEEEHKPIRNLLTFEDSRTDTKREKMSNRNPTGDISGTCLLCSRCNSRCDKSESSDGMANTKQCCSS